MIVEAVRLLVTLSTTAIGFQIGRSWPDWFSNAAPSGDTTIVWGAVLGAGLGYVIGGSLGRTISRSLDDVPNLLDRTPGVQLFAGGFGLGIGTLIGTVVSIPIVLLLPSVAGWPLGGLLVLVLAMFGTKIFAVRGQELFSIGAGRRFAADPSTSGGGERCLVDSSAAIDARVLDLARAGVINRSVWVPAFVIDEMQGIADSSDKSKRRRGRRGLDILDALREMEGVDFAVVEDTVPEHEEVDAKLLALADRAGATLVTTDHNLAKAASLRGIRVLNPHALGESLRPRLNAGDAVQVTIEKQGSEDGQGVGFLDDGTMVVVAGGASVVGETVEAEVANLLRTSVGRMIFAKLAT